VDHLRHDLLHSSMTPTLNVPSEKTMYSALWDLVRPVRQDHSATNAAFSPSAQVKLEITSPGLPGHGHLSTATVGGSICSPRKKVRQLGPRTQSVAQMSRTFETWLAAISNRTLPDHGTGARSDSDDLLVVDGHAVYHCNHAFFARKRGSRMLVSGK